MIGSSRRGSPVKREAILRAGAQVFLQDGYVSAGVDAIATVAGVSKQTIYNHFTDKQSLFIAVTESIRMPALAELHRVADATLVASASADPRQALTAYGRGWLEINLRPDIAALRRLIIAEGPRFPQLQQAWADSAAALFQDRLAGYFEVLTRQGVLRVGDPVLAARQFSALIGHQALSLSLYGAMPLSEQQITDLLDQNVPTLLRAYAARPDRAPE